MPVPWATAIDRYRLYREYVDVINCIIVCAQYEKYAWLCTTTDNAR